MIEFLSGIVTVIILVILFIKIKGSIKITDISRLPVARQDDIECVRSFIPEARNPEEYNSLAILIRNGNLIEAIKLVRKIKNHDLKDSKELVERIKKSFR